MKIEKSQSGTELTIRIIGRLDTTTSPILEAETDQCLAGIRALVLDLGELEYISSAGLRVILKLQKTMSAQGSMTLIHVNDSVMEVFDITGFSDILTIA